MMLPNQTNENRLASHTATFRRTPLQIVHIVGNLMRIWSIYSMYNYLFQTGASYILFVFGCLVPSSIIFLVLQKPWKGRPLSNNQVIPSMINGVITALYFISWGKGVKSCGPLRAILGEYSGAVLGVLSTVLYGRRSCIWKKVSGFLAMVASFYLLSRGWTMATHFPFNILSRFIYLVYHKSQVRLNKMEHFFNASGSILAPLSFFLGLNLETPQSSDQDTQARSDEVFQGENMMIPILAGILSALRRVITRRVSLKNQLKRRLNAITIASATCFLFPAAVWDIVTGSTTVELPFSAWAFSSVIFFGIILIFYVESLAEERLHLVFSSPRHLIGAGACIIVMEITYKMDFSLPGFLICGAILGFGIHEATSLDRMNERSLKGSDVGNGVAEIPPLPI